MKSGNILPVLLINSGITLNSREIGHTVKERRKLLKVKQEDLAAISGISERTLRAIERGDANPELNSLLKLCEVFGMEIKIEVIKTTSAQ